jgi:hypothetical protein
LYLFQARDQHSMALDKLLIAQKSISQLEDRVRELKKQELHNQHQLLSKESVLKRQKIELTRLSADESVLIKDLRQEFEQKLELKEDNIRNLQIVVDNEKRLYQTSIAELNDKIANIELEKVHIKSNSSLKR